MGQADSRELSPSIGRQIARRVYRFRDFSPLPALAKASDTVVTAPCPSRSRLNAGKKGRRQIGLANLCLREGCRVNEMGSLLIAKTESKTTAWQAAKRIPGTKILCWKRSRSQEILCSIQPVTHSSRRKPANRFIVIPKEIRTERFNSAGQAETQPRSPELRTEK